MSAETKTTTAEELYGLYEPGFWFELVKGELRRMSPAGGRHGRIAMRFGALLEAYVRQHQLGAAYAAETGFLIETGPDTVRAPDAAFVRGERLATIDDRGFLPLAPDLAAEVISPNDRYAEVEEKVQQWLAAGVHLVVVIDPQNQTVHAYRTGGRVERLSGSDTLDASPAVPGFRLSLPELFAP